ncbi:MAG TPA: acyl-CoA dehydrogenase [Propionibacteriaceae bacterium]|jgi:alkylation response protein AidB-like acyl-CoA dehydrogenase|nr:acyl-CoA dehydrogenase [Propionibacteriaceae bacterium]
MSHYKSNVRDIEFNLFEVLGREEILGIAPYADLDRETVSAILAEADRLAKTKLAESFADGDGDLPVFDPRTHTVTVPQDVKKSFRALMDSGAWQLELPMELGGHVTPPSVQWAVHELNIGANPSVLLYSAGPKFAYALWTTGHERDQRIAKIMIERQWGATMVLTEPDAGSDVGAGRTKAIPQNDGSWQIEGVKRFITSGEHDLTENIIHLVLARPQGVEGVGGPGTKGLSLYIVPKFHFDLETGELSGERNGVFATNLEKKMGIKGSATCELTFGGTEVPAIGWLLGEVHDGIAQMFHMIEHARMLVGAKAIATLSTGYLNALEYAKVRVQGADLTRAANRTAPRVTIAHHPDVRRSLMTQKSFAEGLRALLLYAATIQDRNAIARANGTSDHSAERLNDLLLPIVKGYGSERSWVLLGTESLQTFGGSGFLTDYPIEQYVRDAKIDTLYEGTTAIQGQDLFLRKIVKDQGRGLADLSAQITQWLGAESGNGQLKEERALLQQALDDVGAIVAIMINDLGMSMPGAANSNPRNVYKVGLNTTRLLMALGDVICAWLLLRGAEVALDRLNADLTPAEKSFYEGKVGSGRWFARTVLPKLAAELAIAEGVDLAIMDLDEAAF